MGPPQLLFTTLYGRTLLTKLCLVGVLVILGAWNQLWLLPRIEAVRAASERARLRLDVLLSDFRRVIALEVAIGLAILFIVPFLSGSARNQAFQAKVWSLKQTATAGGQSVTLRPSALQPGLTNYDVTLPHNVSRVVLRFRSNDLSVPATDVVATAEGNGLYRVSGMYTPMLGKWQVDVLVQDGKASETATFVLPIQAKAIAASSPTPPVQPSTWAYGIVELLLVFVALFAAIRFSRSVAARFKRPATLT